MVRILCDSSDDDDLERRGRASERPRQAQPSPYLRQLRKDYPAPILPWNWEGKVCVLFWIIIFAAGYWLLFNYNNCPRAGTITQCAIKYEMDGGVEFTSEVNCTTVKEERNC